MWLLSLLVVVSAAQYFLHPPPWLFRPQLLALARHPGWLPAHVASGIVAITAGLFQFVGSLRASRPMLHRVLGRVYVIAVVVGGCVGLRLSPDTPSFVADSLNDGNLFETFTAGASTAWPDYQPPYDPSRFLLVMLGFMALAVSWLVTTLAAFWHARQGRFDKHRAWMVRSYSLTFAAVTVRLAPLPLLFLTREPVVAMTLTFWSWVGNLLVAEWLIRRERKPALTRAAAAS